MQWHRVHRSRIEKSRETLTHDARRTSWRNDEIEIRSYETYVRTSQVRPVRPSVVSLSFQSNGSTDSC